MIRRMFAVCLLLAFVAAAKPARAADSFTIGVMNDQSGPYADLSGPGGVEMARMAIEDFGGSVLGKPIELLVADHQNKVDVGLAIARQWYDERGVRAIFDITNSGVALGDPGPRQGSRPDHHFQFCLVIGPDRQGVLAQRHAMERRQLVERRRADAAPDQTRSSTASSSSPPITPSALRSRRMRATPSPKPAGPLSAPCVRRSTPPISAPI